MSLSRRVVGLALAVALATGAGAAFAQSYPNKTLRLITSPPGGGGDFISRVIAQSISEPLGEQVIVDNRPVGGIQGEILSKAPPDGYTLMLCAGDFWVGPLLQKTPYDPVRDFSPIALVAMSPNIVAVNPSLPVKSVKDLIALAKARPGELNYGAAATGGPNHLAAELFRSMSGINIVRVTYKGVGPALNAVIGGEVQMMFANAAGAMPHVKSGRLKGLAVTSGKPSPLAPGLPAVTQSDLPGYESASTFGVFVPAKTPAAVINRLNQEIVRALNRADIKDKLFNAGSETLASSPQEFADLIKSDLVKWGKVIREADIHVD